MGTADGCVSIAGDQLVAFGYFIDMANILLGQTAIGRGREFMSGFFKGQ